MVVWWNLNTCNTLYKISWRPGTIIIKMIFIFTHRQEQQTNDRHQLIRKAHMNFRLRWAKQFPSWKGSYVQFYFVFFFKNSESAQYFFKVNNVTMVHRKIIGIFIAIVSKLFFFGFCEFERHSLFFLSFWEKYPCNGHAFLKTMKLWDIYRTYYWWTIDAVLSRKLMWARNDNKFSPYISNAIHFSKFKLNTWFFFISNSNFVSFL